MANRHRVSFWQAFGNALVLKTNYRTAWRLKGVILQANEASIGLRRDARTAFLELLTPAFRTSLTPPVRMNEPLTRAYFAAGARKAPLAGILPVDRRDVPVWHALARLRGRGIWAT